MYNLNEANGNENNSTKFRYLNDCLHRHASDLANPNTNTTCKLASVSKSVSIRRHPVYARAHGRIGEKNTRLGKVRNREGTTRALRKSGAHNKDGTTPMKKDAGRGAGRGAAGGKRTGDLAQRGSEPRRKRRFVLG